MKMTDIQAAVEALKKGREIKKTAEALQTIATEINENARYQLGNAIGMNGQQRINLGNNKMLDVYIQGSGGKGFYAHSYEIHTLANPE